MNSVISNKSGTELTSAPDYVSNMVAEDTLAPEPQVCYWVYLGNVILQKKVELVNNNNNFYLYSTINPINAIVQLHFTKKLINPGKCGVTFLNLIATLVMFRQVVIHFQCDRNDRIKYFLR